MSLPDELLDELLSAHLDGALSKDECARVEGMLRDDPVVQARLDSLRQQRTLLQQARLTAPKLPADFAEQVVAAAIKRADQEGVEDHHPLRKANNDSFVQRDHGSNPNTNRLIALIVGLAATILIGSFLIKQSLNPNQNAAPGDNLIADSNTDRAKPYDPAAVATESNTPFTSPADPLVASDDTANADQALAVNANTTPNRSEPIASEPNTNQRNSNEPALSDETPESMIATADNDDGVSVEVVSQGPSVNPPAKIRPLNMLMVVKLELSEIGRDSDAVGEALDKLQFEPSEQRQINAALARAVAKDSEPNLEATDQNAVEIMLLESPIRKLDQLVNLIVTDQDGFSSIEFTLISAETDAPLMRSIESVRTLDPTQIRHQGQSIPIASADRQLFGSWSNRLSDRDFLPMRTATEAEMAVGMIKPKDSDQGPGQMGNLLLLIR